MRNLFFLISIFYSFNVFAQTAQKVDTIYYLLDTAKTPVNDRMWEIRIDDQFKSYILNCLCLKFNGMPTFFYSVTDKADSGKIINKSEFKALKLIGLPALIIKSKELLDTEMISYSFFIIEPEGKKYMIHNVALTNPMIHIVSGPDVVQIEADTSAFKAKELIQVNSKELAKYVNKMIVTTGKVVGIRIVDTNKIETLLIGADYPNQDFTIIVRGANLSNFYPMEMYKRRLLKVVGKVIEYMGRPAIELSDDKQMQVISLNKKSY